MAGGLGWIIDYFPWLATALLFDRNHTIHPPNIDGKAFLASRQGVLLGTYFDLDKWTWSIEEKKLSKLLILLHDMVDNDTVSTPMLEKLTGKITHYYPIFSGGILTKHL